MHDGDSTQSTCRLGHVSLHELHHHDVLRTGLRVDLHLRRQPASAYVPVMTSLFHTQNQDGLNEQHRER